MDDQHFMGLALQEAQKAFDAGEVPIGCVIVKDQKVIARGYNQMEGLQDPTAHSEILSIGAACGTLDNWRLDECTLYVTLEPCPMCAGAILNSRIGRVVYAAADKRLGACGSTMNILADNPINRKVAIEPGVRAEEGLEIIQNFFQVLRAKKKAEKQLEA
jgi:tRNA(adenine34) deaminase